jgi:hypothetical protein
MNLNNETFVVFCRISIQNWESVGHFPTHFSFALKKEKRNNIKPRMT